MSILIYRPSLDVRSGAGQLMDMQARGLAAAGESVRLACERGAFKYLLRTGRRAWRYTRDAANARASRGDILVDHGIALTAAHIVFVHNIFSEAVIHLPRADWAAAARQEADYFARLNSTAPIVANSELVKRALLSCFDIGASRVSVHYPGYDAGRFNASAATVLRREARTALRLSDNAPLIGFVTSGDFEKRGLGVFLAAAARIAAAQPECRFLVVGSKRLPETVLAHPLVASGRVFYRRKTARPELWMAALDLFMYAASFEEFGMVVLEAAALGVPILTSRRVGASECLPVEYAPHLLDVPEAELFAAKALELIAKPQARRALVEAGRRSAQLYGRETYAAKTVAAIQAQKLRLK